MSDLNVTVAPAHPLEIPKEGVVTSKKGQSQVVASPAPVKSAPEKKPITAGHTDLNYSINQENNALHLQVKSADGTLVREVVFERIDPSLLDAKKLKGIFVDGNF